MNIYIVLAFTILLGMVVWLIAERNTLRFQLRKERQEHLQLITESDQYRKESVKWGAIDMVNRGKETGIEITNESAQEYLESMVKNHNCNSGITWDTVDDYLWNAVQEGDAKDLNVEI